MGNDRFLDGKTVFAFVAIFLGWLFWQKYMEEKYPEWGKKAVQASKESLEEASTKKQVNVFQKKKFSEKLIKHSNPFFSMEISSIGMGLKNVILREYKDYSRENIRIGGKDSVLFNTRINEKNLSFKIKRLGKNSYKGTSFLKEGLRVEKILKVTPERHLIDVDISVFGSLTSFQKLSLNTENQVFPDEENALFFLPSWKTQEFFVEANGDQEREIVSAEKSQWGKRLFFPQTTLLGLSTHYFAQAFFDDSPTMPQLQVHFDGSDKKIKATLIYKKLNKKSPFTTKFKLFVGPKKLTLLSGIHKKATEIIDLGWFSALGQLIFQLLSFFQKIVGNWGWAIILLTFFVRLLLLPLNIFSFRSMKIMQKIQPQLKDIKDKYKDDAVKRNQEIMTLMKENKANPLGGCLPMLLQFPIFIALYQVLGKSVELYQAPFTLWISDLSTKDPYYTLPVLVGASMFVQQKITPSTMDAMQARILHALPIIFTLFMLNLPSGLNLYIFVSTMFGLIQHYVFMRNRGGDHEKIS